MIFYDVGCEKKMSKPFSKYNDLTVAELKEILKSKNLPVSGTKSILIDRLENSDINESKKNDTKVSVKKVKFTCSQCSTKLKIPISYKGKIKCLYALPNKRLMGRD